MERNELKSVLESNHYIQGGTKEACVKVVEFLRNVINPGNQLHAPLSCVIANEFVDAVKVLMAFAFRQEDTIPETWRCDNDCHMVASPLCPGECSINQESSKICPFFMDEGLI